MTAALFLPTKRVLEIKGVERPAVAYAISRGWLCQKLVSQTAKGWPDRYFLRKGRTVFCEFKRPGEEPNAQQLLRHKEIRDHGGEVVWFSDLEAFRAYFR